MSKLPELALVRGHELEDILFDKMTDKMTSVIDIGQTLRNLPALMSQSTVAKALDMDRSTIHRWVKTGIIPPTFVGGVPRISKEDLLKYLIKNSK